jgi:hypothetical protein
MMRERVIQRWATEPSEGIPLFLWRCLPSILTIPKREFLSKRRGMIGASLKGRKYFLGDD